MRSSGWRGEDPVQQRLMADVRRRVGAKLGELELTVGLRDRKGFDLTRDVIALGAGRAEMEALRATAAEMAAHEGAAAGGAPGRRRRDLPGGADPARRWPRWRRSRR